jgi:hypothetical protein
MLRLYIPTKSFNNSDLVEAKLKPPSTLELVEAHMPGTLPSF